MYLTLAALICSFRDGSPIISDRIGTLRLSEERVFEYLREPDLMIQSYGHQVHRTVDGVTYRVFTSSPHQRMVLTDQLTITTGETSSTFNKQQFWLVMLQFMNQMKEQLSPLLEETIPVPLTSFVGYYGYFSYELSRLLESYQHREDPVSRPYLILDLPTQYIIQSDDIIIYLELQFPVIQELSGIITQPVTSDLTPGKITHDTTYSEYISDLRSIINHIKNGDIYQANYTQQFRLQLPDHIDSLSLYRKILSSNRLPHAAFLNYSQFRVMSISPELFLKINEGTVKTKPIKGTRPRGSNKQEDLNFIDELVGSTKDQAELAMIVDLLRNDLGKSALPASVEVDNHAVVETYENVHHLVSTVSAKIPRGLNASLSLLLRAFPGGSISGVPKLRSLEIIDTYEGLTRDIYTGNIGFIGLTGDIELNIAIRTVIFDQFDTNSWMATFNAGGGIVFDSDPVEEYIESLHKAKHIANYLDHSFCGDIVLLDNQYELQSKKDIEPTDQGIFETILVSEGSIKLWKYHYQRLKQGIEFYNLDIDIPSLADILQLLRLNLVSTGIYRLNIYAWRTSTANHSLVKIQPYNSPDLPLSLLLQSSYTFQVPDGMKAGHKALSYDTYRQATLDAIEHGHWDQLLLSQEGNFLEGGRSTIHFAINGKWITPKTHVVKGTVRQFLLDHDLVEEQDLSVDQLSQVSAIAVSNALIGIKPVISVVNTSGENLWLSNDDPSVENLIQSYLEYLNHQEP